MLYIYYPHTYIHADNIYFMPIKVMQRLNFHFKALLLPSKSSLQRLTDRHLGSVRKPAAPPLKSPPQEIGFSRQKAEYLQKHVLSLCQWQDLSRHQKLVLILVFFGIRFSHCDHNCLFCLIPYLENICITFSYVYNLQQDNRW